MSLASLLHQDFTLCPRTAVTGTGATDRYNNPVYTWPDDATVKGFIYQSTSFERITGRDTTVTNYLLYLLPNTDTLALTEFDRVKDAAGVVYEVDGHPLLATTPRGNHHLEVSIKHIDG